jgi:1,4-dihydroxy-2-naphthoyl-CoA hydrolase
MFNTSDPATDPRLNDVLGFRLVSATRDEVVIEWEVGSKHLQPAGIVHGGVYCAAIESTCSIGATLDAMERFGRQAVGLENHTSFIRAMRSGTLRAVATPITRGRNTQVWEAKVTNEAGELAATGRVRLYCLEALPDSAR